jgi:hypothetical protein
MKFLSLLLALVFSINAGAIAPIGVKGQNQSSIYPSVHQVPNNQATNIGASSVLLETGNNNILANPGFEAPISSNTIPGWTLTGCATAVGEATKVMPGKQSAKITCSAQTFKLIQDSTLYASQFNGVVNGAASARVNTTVATLFVCPRKAGSTDYTQCATVDTIGAWPAIPYRVPFVLSATSNGIEIVSGTISSGTVTPGAVTGDIYVDDGNVEMAKDFDTVPVVTATKDWTPTSTLSTNVTHTGKYALVGDRAYIEFLVTFSGVNTQGAFELNMPTGLVIDTAKLLGSDHTGRLNGFFAVRDASGASTGELPGGIKVKDSGTVQFFVSDDVTGSDKFAVSVNTSTGSPITFASGDTLKGYFNVPIVSQSSTINTLTDQCSTDGACANEFSFDVSGGGTVSNEATNLDPVNGNCATSGTNSATYTCTLNTASLGLTATPSCSVVNNETAASAITLGVTSSTASVIYTTANPAGTATQRAMTVKCTKTGADYKARRQIVGSFKDVPKVVGSSSPVVFGFSYGTTNDTTVCSASPCTYLLTSGGTVSSMTRSGTGIYAVALSQTFSKVFCSGNARGTTLDGEMRQVRCTTSCSSIDVVTLSNPGNTAAVTALDTYGTVWCLGVP